MFWCVAERKTDFTEGIYERVINCLRFCELNICCPLFQFIVVNCWKIKLANTHFLVFFEPGSDINDKGEKLAFCFFFGYRHYTVDVLQREGTQCCFFIFRSFFGIKIFKFLRIQNAKSFWPSVSPIAFFIQQPLFQHCEQIVRVFRNQSADFFHDNASFRLVWKISRALGSRK